MSILRDVQRLIDLAEGKHPKLENSALWNVAKRRALREAVVLETEWQDSQNTGAREGSLGDEECQEPENPQTPSTDLDGMLTELLQRPPLGTSQNSSSSRRTNVVSLAPSKRLRRSSDT